MNIYAESGDKVVFNHPDAGYTYQQQAAAKLLTLGATYTVDHTNVHDCYTDVYLEEFPEQKFNSVLFDDYEEDDSGGMDYIQEAVKTESYDLEAISRRLSDKRTIRTLHAAIGMVTEAAETLDALKKFIFYGRELDTTNLKEEVGDSQWYQAIMCDELGTTFEEVQETNIAKLRARYGQKFSEFRAVNRDLEKERQIIESDPLSNMLEATGKVSEKEAQFKSVHEEVEEMKYKAWFPEEPTENLCDNCHVEIPAGRTVCDECIKNAVDLVMSRRTQRALRNTKDLRKEVQALLDEGGVIRKDASGVFRYVEPPTETHNRMMERDLPGWTEATKKLEPTLQEQLKSSPAGRYPECEGCPVRDIECERCVGDPEDILPSEY
jgi:NTP pyrophosphatase (non-canonical NTP hydrolase)